MSLPADPRARAALFAVAFVVACGLLLQAVDRLWPSPRGPQSSSYATSPHGLAAYAGLLERAGRPVRRLRVPVSARRPRTGETLVVLDPDVVEPGEARAIAAWVRDGGRLVAGGDGGAEWLPGAPRWRGDAPPARPVLVPVPETAGVTEVRGAGGGAWRRLGGVLPAVGPADAPLLVTARRGRGSLALLASAAPLQNQRLAAGDNAAFGLALAGGRPVAFLETVHGYGAARGFGGLPSRVKWLLGGLALAALAGVWAAGRRLGPPEDAERPLPPPRVEYVDALAAALVRAGGTSDKEARP